VERLQQKFSEDKQRAIDDCIQCSQSELDMALQAATKDREDAILRSGMANKDSVKMRPSYIRKNGIPAGRWGEVPDVALAAVFMCSSAATWITGVVISTTV